MIQRKWQSVGDEDEEESVQEENEEMVKEDHKGRLRGVA